MLPPNPKKNLFCKIKSNNLFAKLYVHGIITKTNLSDSTDRVAPRLPDHKKEFKDVVTRKIPFLSAGLPEPPIFAISGSWQISAPTPTAPTSTIKK